VTRYKIMSKLVLIAGGQAMRRRRSIPPAVVGVTPISRLSCLRLIGFAPVLLDFGLSRCGRKRTIVNYTAFYATGQHLFYIFFLLILCKKSGKVYPD
jgi:hypothetical protein